MRERDRETEREITSGALATVEWPQERELIEREREMESMKHSLPLE